MQNDGLKTY